MPYRVTEPDSETRSTGPNHIGTLEDLIAQHGEPIEGHGGELVPRMCEQFADQHRDAMNAILAKVQDEGRTELHASEAKAFEVHKDQVDRLRAAAKLYGQRQRNVDKLRAEFGQTGQMEGFGALGGAFGVCGGAGGPEAQWMRAHDRRPAAVLRGQRFADHEVVRAHSGMSATAENAVIGTHGSLGNLIRSMSTTSGSVIVPTIWASSIIDRARNLAAVLRAGAAIVPMDANTVQIGRLIGDPTAAFRAEGSTITASDPTFDNVTLVSKTMSALVVGSLEWFQDAPNASAIVEEAIAQAVALQLDLVSLFGGITTGGEGINLATPPNPRGVLATLFAVASSNVLGGAANGTAQTPASYWREVQQTVFQPQQFNEEPNAILWNAKLLQQYVDTYDSTNQPLMMPTNIAELARYTTNQIPSFTQGTMTGRATDLFAGDWTKLLIGQRLQFTVQTLTERYAENGQVGIVAHWRGDVALARPRAFAVYRYLQGA
ncbi:MAG: phage major capsid protein [Pseudonocardiaceae bacterium]